MLKLDKQVYRTFKVVNNNIVIVKDSNGREMIAIGKGLGFKKSKNDIVYPEEIMKTYIYLDRQKNLNLTLFEEVPFEVIEVSQHIIDYAAKTLPKYPGMKWKVICGSHDESHSFNYGPFDFGKELEKRRKNESKVQLFSLSLSQ